MTRFETREPGDDFCPECGVAVDIRMEGESCIALCRNPQCGRFGRTMKPRLEKEDEANG